jgi:hypothetical protein
MTRHVHRHATPLPEYADDEIPSPFQELLARDRRAAAPVGILDGLLAKPRREPSPTTAICECGHPACPIGPFVERV